VLGSKDKSVRLWDSATGAEVKRLEGHLYCVYSVAFSPDGGLVVSGSGDKTVRLWDSATGAEVKKLEGHGDPVLSVAFSPDGGLVASGSYDKTVRLWEWDNYSAVRQDLGSRSLGSRLQEAFM